MTEGRYLLGVEPPEKSVAFLKQLANLSVDEEWLRNQGDLANTTRAARGTPTQRTVPCPATAVDHLQQVRSRPLFQRLFAGCEADLGFVDLSTLIPVQPHVDYTFAARSIPAETSEDTLLQLCLPVGPQPIEAWGGVTEAAGQGSFTVLSPDPNLIVTEVHMDTDPHLKVSFTLTKTAVFAVVVEVEGRLFLKDGTHRAVGLLSRGVTMAPAVILRGTDHCSSLPDHLPEETLFGSHPPLLADFVLKDLHLAHPWRPGLKVIRIRADEFMVPNMDAQA